MLIDLIKQDAAYINLDSGSSCPFENIKLCGSGMGIAIMEAMFDSGLMDSSV